MTKVIDFIKKPRKVINYILYHTASLWSDKVFLSLRFYSLYGRKLNFNHPLSFNEKLNWLKLNDFHPEYTKMVDKIEAKKYVANSIGEKYIIPTIAIYNSAEEIDFDSLPEQFVMKCTHDSGGIVICKDKQLLNKDEARNKMKEGLQQKYFIYNREYPYKYISPRVIVEKYMEDESGWQLKDYKIFCFNGEPKFVEVDYDRYVGHKLNVYDLDWNFVDFYMTSPNDKDVHIERPAKLEEMLDIARKLSKGLKFVRVDLYSIKNDIYFGELTHYPGSGFIDFHPKEYDYKLGNLLSLS